MTKVSVALATFNGKKYVEKQLKSLLLQRRKIDEVIIVDDASTDSTADIVKNFIERNRLSASWHFFVNERNLGFLRNFKRAIEKTSGDVIFLCDQDDIWYKTKVDSMLNRFESNEHIKAMYSGFKAIDENDTFIKSRSSLMHSNNNLIKFRIEPFDTVKIEVRDVYIEKTKNICVHDWEIALIAAFLDGLYFFNTPLTNYRIHPGNAIGLPAFSKKSLYSKGKAALSCCTRVDNAKKIYSYLSSMEVYQKLLPPDKLKVLTSSVNFAKTRLKALEEKKFRKLLEVYKRAGKYSRSVTFKGRLADIFCELKN